MPKLSEEPFIHPDATVQNSTLGRYTEVDAFCKVTDTEVGDYSYLIGGTQVWCATIGKFANIAASVRINATNHPMWRATQHHFVYRAANYFDDEQDEEAFFDWRREHAVTIGHDVWIGHGAILLPGVTVGDGAVIGAASVVTKAVDAYTIVAGNPAKPIRRRFGAETASRMQALGWWDWRHDTLRQALPDFRTLSPDDFIAKYQDVSVDAEPAT